MKNKRLYLSLLFFFISSLAAASAEKITVAAVQFPELNHQSEDNFISMVTHFINKAKRHQAKIVLFPELLTLNLLADSDNATIKDLETVVTFNNKYRVFLTEQAKKNKMIIVGGTTLTKKGNQIYNTVLVAFPDGQVQTMDKTLLTPWELSHHITGIGQSKEPLHFKTAWGEVAVLICYESESPEILSKLQPINPDLVLIPSNTYQLSGLERVKVATKYIAVSQSNYALLTGVTTGHPRKEVKANDVGQALLSAPPGLSTDLLGPFNTPALFVVDLHLKKIKEAKKSAKSTFAARDYYLQHTSH